MPYRVGVAPVDITPDHPIRLNGFGCRRTESEGVYQQIHARRSPSTTASESPVVLMTVDVLGIPADIYDELARRLAKAGLKQERLAITATHTHTGPMLTGANPTLFGVPIPKEHQANIDQYTAGVPRQARSTPRSRRSKDLQPARLEWGVGIGGVRHEPPDDRAGRSTTTCRCWSSRTPKGKVRAVYLNYACHCVTLSHNKIGGDWAGFAAEAIEDDVPRGRSRSSSIGCGADQNPNSGVTGDKVDVADGAGPRDRRRGEAAARRTSSPRSPARSRPASQTLDLPLADLPTRERVGGEGEADGRHRPPRPGHARQARPRREAADEGRLPGADVGVRRRRWRWSSCPARWSSITRCG